MRTGVNIKTSQETFLHAKLGKDRENLDFVRN
jgi:hypothetical protein